MNLLKSFWKYWKAFGDFLGNLLARIVLSVFYFSVFMPFAMGVRLFGDPLQVKTLPVPYWNSRITGDQKLEEILRQF
jgi:hypothetical protein